jgi:hypothetical protein
MDKQSSLSRKQITDEKRFMLLGPGYNLGKLIVLKENFWVKKSLKRFIFWNGDRSPVMRETFNSNKKCLFYWNFYLSFMQYKTQITKWKTFLMENDSSKSENCWNTNIYANLETSGDQSSNLYLNVVHFFDTRVD